jgi:hemolysin III
MPAAECGGLTAVATPLDPSIDIDGCSTNFAAWLGALAGIGMTVVWIDAPRGVVALSYVAVGCAVGIAIPELVARLPVAPLVLLAGGGLLYASGAAVYATRRPDPWPRSFGFHEVFHGLVVVAAASHFTAMLVWVVPGAAAVQ